MANLESSFDQLQSYQNDKIVSMLGVMDGCSAKIFALLRLIWSLRMQLKGIKAIVFAAADFEDRELFYPYLRLLEEGAQVVIAGLGEKTYKGKYGIPVETDGTVESFSKDKFDIVIVPGGHAPDKLRANQVCLDIVRKTHESGGIIASICHGPWVLSSTNIIKGVKLTSYHTIKDDMVNAGGIWVDEEVVVDKNVVTSRTPKDLPAFMREVVKLASKAVARS